MGVYAAKQQSKDVTKETELVQLYNQLTLDDQVDAMIVVLEVISERRTELSALQLSELEFQNKQSQIVLKNKIVLMVFIFVLFITFLFLISPMLFRVVVEGNGSLIDRVSDVIKIFL